MDTLRETHRSHCVKTYHSDSINNLVLGLRLDQENQREQRQGGRMDLQSWFQKTFLLSPVERKKPALTVRSHMKQQLPRAVGGDGNMDTIPGAKYAVSWRDTPTAPTPPRWNSCLLVCTSTYVCVTDPNALAFPSWILSSSSVYF